MLSLPPHGRGTYLCSFTAFLSLGSILWRFRSRSLTYLFVKLIPTYLMFFAAPVNGVFKFNFPLVPC